MPMRKSKPLVWLGGDVTSPPFSREARLEAGILLRRLQEGESLSMPHSRPMPTIGSRCHELRVRDGGQSWRIIYHVAAEAIVILDVFSKKSRTTPGEVVARAQDRLARYRRAAAGE